MTEPNWERYSDGIDRIKVDGGFVYRTISQGDVSICFVPDIDLQRYQAHLRDAYKKGYADGQEDAKSGVVNADEGLAVYTIKPEDSKDYDPKPGWRS